jgi:hypothetical protein
VRSIGRAASDQAAALSTIAPLADAVREADKLPFAVRRRADDYQNALRVVLESRLQMDTIGPNVDVALGGQIARPPAYMLGGPDILEARRFQQVLGSALREKRRFAANDPSRLDRVITPYRIGLRPG